MDADPAIAKLEAQLLAALDVLDRINAEDGSVTTTRARDLCAQERQVWSIRLSIAMRQGDHKGATSAQRSAMECEARRLAAEKEIHADEYSELLNRLDEQEQQAEKLHEIPDGDLPDFDPSDEWDDHL